MIAPPPVGTARYLVWLFTPADGRDDVAALLALESEILGSVRAGVEHEVAHHRIEWWAQEAERAARGTPVHPAARRWLVARRTPGAIALPALVETARWDLANVAYESRAELDEYCGAWSRAIFVELADWTLADPPADSAAAFDAGRSIREIELLRALRASARAGRVHLPLEELDRLGVDHAALQGEALPPAVSAVVGERLDRLAAELAAREPALAGPARAWARIARHSARCARRSLPRPEIESRFEPLRRTWLAWRAALDTGKVRAP